MDRIIPGPWLVRLMRTVGVPPLALKLMPSSSSQPSHSKASSTGPFRVGVGVGVSVGVDVGAFVGVGVSVAATVGCPVGDGSMVAAMVGTSVGSKVEVGVRGRVGLGCGLCCVHPTSMIVSAMMIAIP